MSKHSQIHEWEGLHHMTTNEKWTPKFHSFQVLKHFKAFKVFLNDKIILNKSIRENSLTEFWCILYILNI